MAVLVLAVVVVLVKSMRQHRETLYGGLVQQLPVAEDGWTSRDLPIADTPEMKKAVSELLNYDAAVLREFSKDGHKMLVYVAYWKPGRFHPRLITQHVPDNCWVGNGMSLIAAKYGVPLRMHDWVTWPGQYRQFNDNGIKINVIYWHLMGNHLSGYAEGPESINKTFLQGFLTDMRNGVGEQFFIRISSEDGIKTWESNRLVEKVLSVLKPVLAQRND